MKGRARARAPEDRMAPMRRRTGDEHRIIAAGDSMHLSANNPGHEARLRHFEQCAARGIEMFPERKAK